MKKAKYTLAEWVTLISKFVSAYEYEPPTNDLELIESIARDLLTECNKPNTESNAKKVLFFIEKKIK